MKPVIAGMIMICAAVLLIGFSASRVTSGSGNDALLPGSGYPPAGDDLIAELKAGRIANPVMQPGDPYRDGSRRVIRPPADHRMPGAVCAVRFLDPARKRYEIKTIPTGEEAVRSGYTVTHAGYCGTCSTLQDLAVYLQRRDMTYAVRSCSFRMLRGPILSCLEKMGFSRQCALTWYYNIRNTGRSCLGVCLASWLKREPLNGPDGRLNPCLQCDEDMSGPIFKYQAGRTRRNSGIRSEIERRGDEIYPLKHDRY